MLVFAHENVDASEIFLNVEKLIIFLPLHFSVCFFQVAFCSVSNAILLNNNNCNNKLMQAESKYHQIIIPTEVDGNRKW